MVKKKSAGRKKTTKKKTSKKKASVKKKVASKKNSKKKTSKKTTKKQTKKKSLTPKKNEKAQKVLDKALEKIQPDKKLMENFQKDLDSFVKKVKKRISDSGLEAEVFVGGSFAKDTVVKKEKYDADVFIRFSKEYKDKDLSKLTKKLLKGMNKQKIHGSRDYFRLKPRKGFIIEVVPVLKIDKPEEAENVTDLSYSHVKYIKDKVKSKKIINEIKLAKAFCEANKCYGAESYIHGFSGYALELLIIYYGSFLNFIRDISKFVSGGENEKLVIDIEGKFKNKNEVMLDMNKSKLQSPIILIDPTYKKRNSLAALSLETFEKFREISSEFLSAPDLHFFEKQKTDINEVRKQAKVKGKKFTLLEAKTKKQPGDIAGTKLSKFYKHLTEEISKYFEIHDKGFNYNMKKSARFFFVLKPKKEIVFMGPLVRDTENVKKFKKQHKNVLQKGGRFYAIEKIDFGIKQFLKKWKKKNKRKMKEMSIKKLRILE